jgi:S1-C subfamily serine protease
MELQAKLLRVLEERVVEPLGSHQAVDVDVRVLSATSIDLAQAVKAGRFRADLLYRLEGARVALPPLRDRKLDIAIIKVSESGLPEAQLGNSEKLRPGQWVIAIGNPYQFSNTVTFGIISALARNLDALDKNNLIQTDAPINPGNSGGPLINMKGEVIGINVAIDARATGIGFAIPINAVKNIMDDLIKKGKIVRPWVGVYMRNVDKEIADYLNLPVAQGVVVVDVAEDSPAANARLEKYDVIRKIEGQTVKDSKQLADLVAGYAVGKKVSVEYWREGKLEKTQIKIGEQP